MKILHESPECYIQQCCECGAVLQYSRNDIYIPNIEHILEDGPPFYCSMDHIRCPACGNFITATKEWFYDQSKFKNS